jgi:hypothetical protein
MASRLKHGFRLATFASLNSDYLAETGRFRLPTCERFWGNAISFQRAMLSQ